MKSSRRRLNFHHQKTHHREGGKFDSGANSLTLWSKWMINFVMGTYGLILFAVIFLKDFCKFKCFCWKFRDNLTEMLHSWRLNDHLYLHLKSGKEGRAMFGQDKQTISIGSSNQTTMLFS